VLINTARGALIDEAALIAALRGKRIAGAALDVFEGLDVFALDGGRPNHPLLELDNVILTPHCAGSSVESTRESKVRGVRNAVDVLQGRWPRHVVNPGVQPRWPLKPVYV
jgi:D-3-phosphoglycerate dehydrogenase / 2-oxoglutarate reductase